jgi:rubrerythrin
MSSTRDEFLNTAIQFERDGFDFYTEAAKNAQSDLARGVFESLAQDELRHISFLKTLSTGDATVKSENESLAARLRPIFRGAGEGVQQAAQTAEGDIAALNLGIEREDKAVQTYGDAAAGAEDDEFRSLCETLVGIEAGHRKLLENVVEYLEHPDSFFLREERWVVEG